MGKKMPWLHKPKVIYQPPIWILTIWFVLTIIGWCGYLTMSVEFHASEIENRSLKEVIKNVVP
jgi:hypothetical protein